ncbi:hypothetical protein HDU85_005241 [Gaertneriomyces sp. JEL0708]|nr:hypothetical protein HDU85_005241 [Gaertneriomyces sp. JEL0708]
MNDTTAAAPSAPSGPDDGGDHSDKSHTTPQQQQADIQSVIPPPPLHIPQQILQMDPAVHPHAHALQPPQHPQHPQQSVPPQYYSDLVRDDSGASLASHPTIIGEASRGLIHAPVEVHRHTFFPLFERFLKQNHYQNPAARHCRLTEHFAKFDSPPKNQKRTFDTFDFFLIIKEVGGVEKVKSWSDVARRLGFDPRGSNIAARIKDWMVYHHIGAFFDYLLGIPNDFYMHEPVADDGAGAATQHPTAEIQQSPPASVASTLNTPGNPFALKRNGAPSEDEEGDEEGPARKKRGKKSLLEEKINALATYPSTGDLSEEGSGARHSSAAMPSRKPGRPKGARNQPRDTTSAASETDSDSDTSDSDEDNRDTTANSRPKTTKRREYGYMNNQSLGQSRHAPAMPSTPGSGYPSMYAHPDLAQGVTYPPEYYDARRAYSHYAQLQQQQYADQAARGYGYPYGQPAYVVPPAHLTQPPSFGAAQDEKEGGAGVREEGQNNGNGATETLDSLRARNAELETTVQQMGMLLSNTNRLVETLRRDLETATEALRSMSGANLMSVSGPGGMSSMAGNAGGGSGAMTSGGGVMTPPNVMAINGGPEGFAQAIAQAHAHAQAQAQAQARQDDVRKVQAQRRE